MTKGASYIVFAGVNGAISFARDRWQFWLGVDCARLNRKGVVVECAARSRPTKKARLESILLQNSGLEHKFRQQKCCDSISQPLENTLGVLARAH